MVRTWSFILLTLACIAVPVTVLESAESQTPTPLTLNVVPPRGDCLRYVVRPFPWFQRRIWSDYLRITAIWQCDTLARDALWSEFIKQMMAKDVPDSAHLQMTYAIERYEQTLAGHITGGPGWYRLVRVAEVDRLLEKDLRQRMSGTVTLPPEPMAGR